MQLKLKSLLNYATKTDKIHDRRAILTVMELDRDRAITGREWSVTYDPAVTDSKKLSRMVDAQAGLEQKDDDLDADEALSTEYLDLMVTIFLPVLSSYIATAVNESRDRVERLALGEKVDPEQVLIDRIEAGALNKLVYKAQPFADRIAAEINNSGGFKLRREKRIRQYFGGLVRRLRHA